ncbi:hypothetical protein Pint_30576 [Pistacia integerrima]|uniref:Uncharacterized protein n=1 Tax=Pistacia integerrima TaxID=434235 RepID=A0ACC0WYG9_9ROSI|nr:hypothetical protein Pint_30576 [Pistacia integerrima]
MKKFLTATFHGASYNYVFWRPAKSEKKSNLRACFLDANSGTTFNLDARMCVDKVASESSHPHLRRRSSTTLSPPFVC